MILVTGAAGKTGTAVIRQLVLKGEAVRAWVRRETQVDAVREWAVVEVIERVIGRSAHAQQVPIRQWRQQAQQAGLGEYQIETLIKMFDYYGRYHFEGNGTVLWGLLARPLTDLDTFIRQLAIGSK
jgi:hypothetical protein